MDKEDKLSQSMTFAMVKGQLQIVDGMWVESLLSETADARPVIIDGKYKVLDIIGQGGMGTVYCAEQLKLGREVALKTFRSKEIPPDVWRRFEREARAVAQLNHENIIKVYDFGITEDNRPFYTMELLSGESLEERLDRQGALSLAELYYIFARVFEALKYTHEKNIVHRDIKPANVFLTLKDGQITGVKLVDFGIAGLVTDMGAVDQKLTDTGTIFGSPLYMSPEQSRGENLDARTDIYSCGCMLFECLTGATPYRGKSALETIIMHQGSPVPPLPAKSELQEEIPNWLNQLYGLMMQKNRDNRIGSCGESFDVMSFQLKEVKKTVRGGLSRESMDVEKSTNSNNPLLNKTTVPLIIIALLGFSGLAAWFCLAPHAAPPLSTSNPSGKAPVSSKENTGYWSFSVPAAPHKKAFLFPKTAIGTIEVFGIDKNESAQGLKSYNEKDLLIFTASTDWPTDPKQWNGFGPADLSGIELPGPTSLEHLKKICGKPTLVKIFVADSNIGPPVIDEINKLDGLVSLKLYDGKLSADDYARLKRLPYLRELYIYDCKDTTPILKRLTADRKELRLLSIKGCTLKDIDIKLLSQLKRLVYLDLTNTNVTAAQLSRLGDLTSLKWLFLNGTPMKPSESKVISTFKELQYLMVSPSWTEGERIAVTLSFPTNQLVVTAPLTDDSKEDMETMVQFSPEKL